MVSRCIILSKLLTYIDLRSICRGKPHSNIQSKINAMEQAVKELEAVNAEVDNIREQLAPKVAKLKVAMDCVKEAYAEKKKTLKGYYPQERWMDYGVPDKR